MKTKITKLLLIAILLIAAVSTADAASKKEETTQSAAKEQLKAKASKAAKQETKQLEKDGWVAAPGALPLEKQLDRAYLMQLEVDENYQPKFIISEAMSIGENYDGAKLQALELAKQNLAGQVESQMSAIIENSVSNSQLAANEAATITETISASKNVISQKLGRTITVTEVYRTLKNKNKEVLVRIAYSSDSAMNTAKTVIKDELRKRGNALHDQLDKALGF